MDFDSLPDDNAPAQPVAAPNVQSPQPQAPQQPAPMDFDSMQSDEEKNAEPLEQAKGYAEAAGRGFAGPLATAAERAMGVQPEDIARRQQIPGTGGVEGGAFLGSALAGTGEAALLGKAAEAVGLGAEALKTGTFLQQYGPQAIQAAFEGALLQGGEEVHKALINDPQSGAENAIANMGMAAALTGALGPVLGAGLKKLLPGAAPEAGTLVSEATAPETFISELDRAKLDAGDLKTNVKYDSTIPEAKKDSIFSDIDLGKQKANAPEIKAFATERGYPLPEAITSDAKGVHYATDSLIDSPFTYYGDKVGKVYKQGYDMATNDVSNALGEGSKLSAAQTGDAITSSMTNKIEESYAPIKAMYDEISPTLNNEILPTTAIDKLSDGLKEIPELRVAPSSDEGMLVRRVLNDLPNAQTVNDLKIQKKTLNTVLSNPTANPGQKRIASIILDKMNDTIGDSIVDPAIKASLDEANSQYAPFIKKVGQLSDILGKGKIHGPQDALDFINKLDPETVTKRLFNKNSSRDLSWFGKNFPEEMEMLKGYQKGILRDKATSSADGQFTPKMLFSQLDKLQPEIKDTLLGKEDQRIIDGARQYLEAFPKKFNPSGTAAALSTQHFFGTNPIAAGTGAIAGGLLGGPVGSAIGAAGSGALAANVADAAKYALIKASARAPETLGATTLGKAAASGYNVASRASKAIFNPNISMPASIAASIPAREKIQKLVASYTQDPSKMMKLNDNNPLPQYAQNISATSARAVQYLNSIKPNTDKANPLDSETKPSPDAIAKYNRASDLAQNPALALKAIKDGNITTDDIATLNAIYPNYTKQLRGQLINEMMNTVAKKQSIPYKTRIGLSLFTATPMDSTLTQSGIAAAQQVFLQNPSSSSQQGQMQAKAKKGTAALNKGPASYQTQSQAAESDRAKR